MNKKRIILIGNNSGMETLCHFFYLQSEVSVVALIHSDKQGSEEIAAKYAEKYGAERIYHPSRKDKERYSLFLEHLSELKADLAICFSYDRIFDKDFLAIFGGEVYNLHGALLPKYRGQNVLNWVLVNGESKTGMTLHRMDEGIDSGPIVYQSVITIDFEDTAVTLKEKMNNAVLEILNRFLPDIVSGDIRTFEQNEMEATYYHKRTPEDGKFEWSWPTMDIYNLIRALVAPWPGAYYMQDKKKMVIDDFMKYEDVVRMKKEINACTQNIE